MEAVRRTVDVDDSQAAVRLLSVLNACAIASILVLALTRSFGVAIAAYLGVSTRPESRRTDCRGLDQLAAGVKRPGHRLLHEGPG